MVLSAFASLVDPIAIAFDIDKIWITVMLTMSHYIYIPMHFVTSQLYLKLEPIRVFQIAVLLQLVGAWIRLLAFGSEDGRFWILFIGNVIFDLCSPLIFNGMSLVTTAWFGEQE